MRFLLDTNIMIGILKGPGDARKLVDHHGATRADCAVSLITRMELSGFHGITDESERQILVELNAMRVLPLDDDVEQAVIALRRRTRLKLPDAIIAATAQVHDLELLTLDARLAASLQSLH